MSSEKPDEFLTWRTLLSPPDALPEQGLDDPEAVWERLNVRLRRDAGRGEGAIRGESAFRERRAWRRPGRYGIAAVLLLLLAGPAVWLYRGTRGGERVVGTGASREASAVMKGAVAGTRAAGADRAAGSRGPMVAENPVVTRPGRAKSLRPVSAKTGERLVAVVTAPRVTMPSTLSDSGARLAALTTPVRKPLRVVSINEIDHPGTTGPSMTAQWPRFRITLNPRGDALLPETAVQEKGSTFLKINLAP